MVPATSIAFICKYCSSPKCIRKGNRGNAIRMCCKSCGKHQQTAYVNRNYTENDENEVRKHHNEGLGIRSISRLLNIPATSVQMLMKCKAAKLTLPKPTKENGIYLVDELQTFVGQNTDSHRRYVISAMDKRTGEIVAVTIGRRNQKVIREVTDQLCTLKPKRIVTDGWNGYAALIPETIYK